MRLWPDTILGRTLAVFLLGFVVLGIVSFGLMMFERQAMLSGIGGWHAISRIAGVTEVMNETPAQDRRNVLRNYQGPAFRVFWSAQSPLPDTPLDWQDRMIREAMQSQLGNIPEGGFRIGISPDVQNNFRDHHRPDHMRPDHMRPDHMRFDHSRFQPRPMMISLQLNDQSWLTFSTPTPKVGPVWRSRSFWPGLFLILLIVGGSVWAVRKATRPLGVFAKAAERLGLDVNADPMAEDGPREVRRAAKAFNTMQARLQAFIKDRTHMLAAISHDLRTPITRLKLRAEFITDDEQRTKMLADLDEMEAMIAATLNFARDDAANEPTSVLDLSALISSLTENHAVKTDLPDTCSFTGRPIGLKRMIANVLNNAERFAQNAEIALDCQDEQVIITVTDDGPGIPDDMLERVFDPFVRVEESRSRETGGTGLGLSAVRSIAHAHGGQVKLSNRTEGGLKVEITLPRF